MKKLLIILLPIVLILSGCGGANDGSYEPEEPETPRWVTEYDECKDLIHKGLNVRAVITIVEQPNGDTIITTECEIWGTL